MFAMARGLTQRTQVAPKTRLAFVTQPISQVGDEHGQQEHDLPLVRRHRGGRSEVLRRDLSGQRSGSHRSRARRLSRRQAGRCPGGRVHRAGHSLHGPQRRPGDQAQRGVLIPGCHRRPSRNRPPVERDRWQRGPGKRMRLVQGQVGVVVADHPTRPH
ncbi:hypothetical protein D3C84_818410 [compost metagenome]